MPVGGHHWIFEPGNKLGEASPPRTVQDKRGRARSDEKSYNFARLLSMLDGGTAPMPDVRRGAVEHA